LDASNYTTNGVILLTICIPLCLLGLWLVVIVVRRQDIGMHPIMRSLASYGDPVDIAQSIDWEVQTGGQDFEGMILTHSWLLKPNIYNLTILRLDDLVWIYQKITQHSINGINTGQSVAAVLCTRQGKSLELRGSNFYITELFKDI